MEKNYWPDLGREENTKEIFKFINILKQQLIDKYNGKLNCSFEEIKYESNGIASMSEAVSHFKRIAIPQETKGSLETSKRKVDVRKCKEFKFLIYSNDYFFRVFDVKIGEYFPIQMRPGEELSNIDYNYCQVESFDAFRHRVQYYLNNKTIKDVISYMLSL